MWSPVAKEIELELISKDGKKEFIDLKYNGSGLWELKVNADLEGYRYRYRVRINEHFKTITDPYGISSNANGEYNYIIDKNKLKAFKNPKPHFSGRAVDAVIYIVDTAISPLSSGTSLPATESLCLTLLDSVRDPHLHRAQSRRESLVGC